MSSYRFPMSWNAIILGFRVNSIFWESVWERGRESYSCNFGCVWIGWKPFPEIIFRKTHAFGSYGKYIFRKIISVWPKFAIVDPKIILQNHFTFKHFPHTRKRERESHRKKELNEQKREQARERTIQTPITKRTKRRLASVPNADPPLRSKCRFRLTPVMPSSPHCRSFMVVRSPSFRKTHGEFSFHLWPIRPPIHTSPHRRCTVTEPHLRKTHKSNPHTSWIRCAFYIYIYISSEINK